MKPTVMVAALTPRRVGGIALSRFRYRRRKTLAPQGPRKLSSWTSPVRPRSPDHRLPYDAGNRPGNETVAGHHKPNPRRQGSSGAPGELAHHEYPRDPATLDLLGGEAETLQGDHLTLRRNRPEQAEHEPADRVPAITGQIGADQFVQLADGQARVHAVAPVADSLHVTLLHVVFVRDFTHQLFEQVFQRHEAGVGSILVDHDGHVELLALHLAKETARLVRFRNEVRRTH